MNEVPVSDSAIGLAAEMIVRRRDRDPSRPDPVLAAHRLRDPGGQRERPGPARRPSTSAAATGPASRSSR